jgi:SAM-dependent methyltransferase
VKSEAAASVRGLPSCCLLCGGKTLTPVAGRAALCGDCGLLINLETHPLDYADGGGQAPPDATKMRWRLENARMRLALIEPHLAGHDVFIDIGCGSGEMLAAAAVDYATCIGFDTNAPLICHIRATSDATVFEAPFSAALLPAATHGHGKVFALSHVLEHLERPLALVDEVAAAMAPGDLCYIEVPLHTGEAFRSQQFGWNLWNHEHVALYSAQALDFIARHAGLDIRHRGTRVFARGSRSGKTRLRLLRRSPVRFVRALWSKGRHSVADVLLADYGCVVLRKPG